MKREPPRQGGGEGSKTSETASAGRTPPAPPDQECCAAIMPLDQIRVGPLVRYDSLCRVMAEVYRVDEVKTIRDKAVAMQAYARQAKDQELIRQATEIRMRAERRAGELLREMEKNKGAVLGKTGRKGQPVLDTKPKLSDLGVSKTQSSRWQALAAIPEKQFEAVVADARCKVDRAVRNAVREVEIEQERTVYTARTEQGGTEAHLEALIQAGRTFGVIVPDFPWSFEVYSGKGKQRSAERHYDTWSLERIMAMAPLIRALAADDCVLLLWAVSPEMPEAIKITEACGFDYKTVGFYWVKTTPNATLITLDGKGLHWGMGYHTRSNVEPCLLATRGSPPRLAADVHQVVIAPVGEHSAKPDEVYRRIERLYPGPRLELFARKPRDGWVTWGNEIERDRFNEAARAEPERDEAPSAYDSADDVEKCFGEAYRAIRERKANGGPGWTPGEAASEDDPFEIPECLRRTAPPKGGAS